MPRLEAWFHSSTTISSTSVVVPSGPLLLYSSRFIIFCYMSEGHILPINATNCELVIFRKSAVGHYLVNLWPGDGCIIGMVSRLWVICTCVLTFFLIGGTEYMMPSDCTMQCPCNKLCLLYLNDFPASSNKTCVLSFWSLLYLSAYTVEICKSMVPTLPAWPSTSQLSLTVASMCAHHLRP